MKDSFSVVALVSLMIYQNWKLALFAILMMPLAGGLAKSLGKRIGKATSKAGVSSGNLASFLSEIFKGSKMIKIYQKESDENEKAKNVIDDLVEKNIKIGKAGRNRWRGKRPQTRGVAMNPVDHPHGGGEGKTSGGRSPVSPWGQSAKGLKTRKPKRSDRFIISRRKKRNK